MTEPDPLSDLLPVDRPVAFDRLPDAERRWRLRLYLATSAIGASAMFSWATAMNDEPVHVAESIAILADISDEAIREAVNERQRIETRAWWDGLLAESRAAMQESRVTILSRIRGTRPT